MSYGSLPVPVVIGPVARLVPGAGVTSHKKSELRPHQMARKCEVPVFTPHKIHVETLWISGLCHLGPKGVLALPLREGSLRCDTEPHTTSFRLFLAFLLSFYYCSGRIVVAALYCRIHAVTYGSIDTTSYGCIDVTPATHFLSNPQLCFVGTVPSTGRPGWSNKGYPRGRHARALVKALADSPLGFWPRCPLSVGLSRELCLGSGAPGWALHRTPG